MAGSGLVVVVDGETVGELVHAASAMATTTNANAHGVLVLMLTVTS
jgi:hypothetical protein